MIPKQDICPCCGLDPPLWACRRQLINGTPLIIDVSFSSALKSTKEKKKKQGKVAWLAWLSGYQSIYEFLVRAHACCGLDPPPGLPGRRLPCLVRLPGWARAAAAAGFRPEPPSGLGPAHQVARVKRYRC